MEQYWEGRFVTCPISKVVFYEKHSLLQRNAFFLIGQVTNLPSQYCLLTT